MASDTQIDTKAVVSKPSRIKGALKNVTKEMYKRNYELAQINRTLSLLRQVDGIALATHETLDAFCEELSKAITKTAEFPFVGFITQPLSRHSSVSYHGFASTSNITDPSSLSYLHIDPHAGWYKDKDISTLIPASHLIHSSLEVLPDMKEHVDKISDIILKDITVKTISLTKLTSRQKIVGVMVIGFQQAEHEISKSDIELIQRLGESIGVAVDSKLLFEENQLIVKQLQKANDKLKALDETKDDFISMASHQLRTPLTSVKGYLSMVLDGDVGSVSKAQKDMLNQAFFSSQRMVYLIADLLNVSRLRTGKFVIEPAPVNLAEITKEELAQLDETATSKKLELTYDQPKSFPTLMLDETKTRQVIMNFVDNAIYYTPAGGKIAVRLIDKPTTIELRVEDNGIGVPKAEQHHLFTKFYRAGNARKARPDGTGLGLFMAKKVVVAEGGAIIFDSTEGKGSIFGFSFSKAKLAVKPGSTKVTAETKKTKTEELVTA